MAKGILTKFLKDTYELLLGKDTDDKKKSVAEKLQTAVRNEIELANLKETTAAAAASATVVYRQELAKLVAQSEELHRQALKSQKAGDETRAKKILALKLAIDDKITAQSDVYQKSDEVAKNAIVAAKKQFKAAQETAQDLPRRVMQLEINAMMEKAQEFEKSADNSMTSWNYRALANSIDLKTAQLSARALIENSSELGLDDQVSDVIKDARFEQEYTQLIKNSETITDAEYTVVDDNPLQKAKKLLTEPAFGGLLSIFTDKNPGSYS